MRTPDIDRAPTNKIAVQGRDSSDGLKVWTSEEVCQICQITPDDLQDWIRQGLRVGHCRGGSVRISQTALDAFLGGESSLGNAIFRAVHQIGDRLAALESAVSILASQRTVKEWYTTHDIAAMFDKAEYTVREWCRLGRINAVKIPSLRGGEQEWRISHAEVVRYQNEGLLPIPRKY